MVDFKLLEFILLLTGVCFGWSFIISTIPVRDIRDIHPICWIVLGIALAAFLAHITISLLGGFNSVHE